MDGETPEEGVRRGEWGSLSSETASLVGSHLGSVSSLSFVGEPLGVSTYSAAGDSATSRLMSDPSESESGGSGGSGASAPSMQSLSVPMIHRNAEM